MILPTEWKKKVKSPGWAQGNHTDLAADEMIWEEGMTWDDAMILEDGTTILDVVMIEEDGMIEETVSTSLTPFANDFSVHGSC